MSDTLYELSERYAALLDDGEVIDPTTGEVIEEDDARFNILLGMLEGDLTEKMKGCCAALVELGHRERKFREEAKRLTERARVYANRAESLKGYMRLCMERTGSTKVETDVWTVSRRAGRPRVVVTNEDELPERFKVYKTQADKKAIGEAFKDGLTVPGAVMETGPDSIIIK